MTEESNFHCKEMKNNVGIISRGRGWVHPAKRWFCAVLLAFVSGICFCTIPLSSLILVHHVGYTSLDKLFTHGRRTLLAQPRTGENFQIHLRPTHFLRHMSGTRQFREFSRLVVTRKAISYICFDRFYSLRRVFMFFFFFVVFIVLMIPRQKTY